MALSQDEQRILAEIERRLATDDPGLASSLTTFRRPGPAKMLLRSPRARIVGSLFTVLLVAMVSLTVYAMIPFRAHLPRQAPSTAGGQPAPAISAATSGQPSATSSHPAPGSRRSASTGASHGQLRAARRRTAASKPQQGTAQADQRPRCCPPANP